MVADVFGAGLVGAIPMGVIADVVAPPSYRGAQHAGTVID
jgi:hypothetical protein